LIKINTLHGFIERADINSPDDIAISQYGIDFSYHDLNTAAEEWLLVLAD
jgi:hypothetical protein